jgi:hypothetical protein
MGTIQHRVIIITGQKTIPNMEPSHLARAKTLADDLQLITTPITSSQANRLTDPIRITEPVLDFRIARNPDLSTRFENECRVGQVVVVRHDPPPHFWPVDETEELDPSDGMKIFTRRDAMDPIVIPVLE